MTKDPSYPRHLSEDIRIQIAKDYIKQDLRKVLPHVRGADSWNHIDHDIDSWFDLTSPVTGPRDFWNRFDGIAMGGKLKIGLVEILTAENVTWELIESLPLDTTLASGGGLGYIHPELQKKRLRAAELRTFSEKKRAC